MRNKSPKNKNLPRKGLLERRERILKAAAEVFAEKGIEKATVDEIAAKAGVGKGTIYRRAGKKEDIINLLIETSAQLLIDNIKAEIKKRTDPILQFKEAVYALCDLYENNLNLMVIFMIPEIASYKMQLVLGKKKFLDGDEMNVFWVIGSILQKAIEKGQLRPVDPYIVSKGLCYFLNPLFYRYLRFESNLTKGEIAQLTIDLFLDGLKMRK